MIEPLREKVSHFLENNELSQNVKTHWDSYSKFFQTAFLIVSLAFGICSAKRDCPKIYHDNGSLSRYLTSPEQCAWPIIANIINGIDLLCKCYKFCTWIAGRKEKHQADGSQHKPASPIHEQGQRSIPSSSAPRDSRFSSQGVELRELSNVTTHHEQGQRSIPSSSTPRDSRFSSQGVELRELYNVTTHHEQASVTNHSPKLNGSNPDQVDVSGHVNGPEEVSEPRSSQTSYRPSLGSASEDYIKYNRYYYPEEHPSNPPAQIRRVSTGRSSYHAR